MIPGRRLAARRFRGRQVGNLPVGERHAGMAPEPFAPDIPLGRARRRPRRGGGKAVHQRTWGSSSKVWKGGGEETCHSRVVAPAPHWLAGTVAGARKVRQTT